MAASAPLRQSHEEGELAQAFARREPWAFEDIYRRYASLLYTVAFNVLGADQEAQDAVHDALARLWKHPGAFCANRGTVRAFLVVCVRNQAISVHRKHARRARLHERLAMPESAQELEVDDFIERRRLRAALADLPQDQRAALELAFFGGKTHVQVARELGQPLGTVKSRIAMGLRKLAVTLRTQVLA